MITFNESIYSPVDKDLIRNKSALEFRLSRPGFDDEMVIVNVSDWEVVSFNLSLIKIKVTFNNSNAVSTSNVIILLC
jgi:hypothetical protein